MQYNFKRRKTRTSIHSIASQIPQGINFRIKRKVAFGKAVFVCGNIPQLGFWSTQNSFRLSWSQGDFWVGHMDLNKGATQVVQFKFIISDWEIVQNNNIEWQQSKSNRSIDLNILTTPSQYNAEWNKMEIRLCLHSINGPSNHDRYFVTGSHPQLGNWDQYKELSPISKSCADDLNMYFKADLDFLSEVNLSSFYVYSFMVDLNVQSINYTFNRKRNSFENESYMGRSINFHGEGKANGRIKQINWMGSKFIIDEPSFDHLVLQKITNQLFFANNLNSCCDFSLIQQKSITSIFNINSADEDCAISNYHLATLCKNSNIDFKQWTVEELATGNFVEEAGEIVSSLESLLVAGHRVCINCSRKLIMSTPVKVLYLTLLEGYPFLQAIELVRKQASITKLHEKIAQEVLCMVNNKICRGKTQIKSH